jgi:hypothetical protein
MTMPAIAKPRPFMALFLVWCSPTCPKMMASSDGMPQEKHANTRPMIPRTMLAVAAPELGGVKTTVTVAGGRIGGAYAGLDRYAGGASGTVGYGVVG